MAKTKSPMAEREFYGILDLEWKTDETTPDGLKLSTSTILGPVQVLVSNGSISIGYLCPQLGQIDWQKQPPGNTVEAAKQLVFERHLTKLKPFLIRVQKI